MSVRQLGSGDGVAARRLWDELGGWYRNTSPAADGDVDRAIGRILRASTGGRRPRRGSPAEAGWVAGPEGSVSAWLYARADPEENYVVPLVPPEDSSGALAGLLDEARSWFVGEGARRFVMDVPDGRADLRRVADSSGRRIWHRQVLDRNLAGPGPVSGSSAIRGFRRSDLSGSQNLFAARHPEKLPPPIPVAFLELRGGWFRDPAWAMQRSVWVATADRELLGVAGGTHRAGATIGFLGPWILAETTSSTVAEDLLSTLLAWLGAAGALRVRTSVPVPLNPDARSLVALGFAPMAESDLYEFKA